MSRSILTRPGKEHPNPCEGWTKMVEDGRISYEWAACDCSMMERRYQILKDGQWLDIAYCPFCVEKINYWQASWYPIKLKLKCPNCNKEFEV